MTKIDVLVMPSTSDGLITTRSAPSLESFQARAPEIADAIGDVASSIKTRLDERDSYGAGGGWSMDGGTLAFELALAAEAVVIIARASTAATFSIEIKWSRSD